MDTNVRDNALAKSRLLLNLTLIWALGSSLLAIILVFLCSYLVLHKETHWIPICVSEKFQISEKSYSPSYLKDMAERVVDLRLTYNKDNTQSRFNTLLMLTDVAHQGAFKELLDNEQKTIENKDVSSVFYVNETSVDITHQKAQVRGVLHQASRGIALKPEFKIYELKFSYKSGLLGLLSMQEVNDDKR